MSAVFIISLSWGEVKHAGFNLEEFFVSLEFLFSLNVWKSHLSEWQCLPGYRSTSGLLKLSAVLHKNQWSRAGFAIILQTEFYRSWKNNTEILAIAPIAQMLSGVNQQRSVSGPLSEVLYHAAGKPWHVSSTEALNSAPGSRFLWSGEISRPCSFLSERQLGPVLLRMIVQMRACKLKLS